MFRSGSSMIASGFLVKIESEDESGNIDCAIRYEGAGNKLVKYFSFNVKSKERSGKLLYFQVADKGAKYPA